MVDALLPGGTPLDARSQRPFGTCGYARSIISPDAVTKIGVGGSSSLRYADTRSGLDRGSSACTRLEVGELEQAPRNLDAINPTPRAAGEIPHSPYVDISALALSVRPRLTDDCPRLHQPNLVGFSARLRGGRLALILYGRADIVPQP